MTFLRQREIPLRESYFNRITLRCINGQAGISWRYPHHLGLFIFLYFQAEYSAVKIVITPKSQAAVGCHPASAHSSPLTAELEIMKQMASAISSEWIRRPSWVY